MATGLYGIETLTPLRALHRGEAATVWLCTDRTSGRRVVAKVSVAPLTDLETRSRFDTETYLLEHLSRHPSVIPLVRTGITPDDRGVAVLEHAEGGDLKARLHILRTTPEQALVAAIQLADAVQAVHDLGYIHRDIKPANVLLSAKGAPMLADLASARRRNLPEGAGPVEFSIPWAAPEVLADDCDGSVASDVYSLGATAFALLTGRSPFEYGYRVHSHDELVRMVLHEPLPRIAGMTLPDGMEDALRRALCRDPAGRFPSAREFARALQEVQFRAFGYRTPLHAVSGETLMDAVSTAPAVPAIPMPEAEKETPPTRRHGRAHAKPRRLIVVGTAAAIVCAATAGGTAFALLRHGSDDADGHASAIRLDDGGMHEDGVLDSGHAAVPSPTDVHGSTDGDTVTFTWTNPDPRHGDTYAWQPVDERGTPLDAAPRRTDRAEATLPDERGTTCIAVSIVRDNMDMSAKPTRSCAR